MKSNASLYQSTNSSTSTLRPRNNRLISFIEDDNDESTATSSSAQPSKTPPPPLFANRGTSPSGNGPTRTRSLNKGSGNGGRVHTRTTSEGAPAAPPPTDLWTSWSTYASSFLGADAASAHQSMNKGKGKSDSRPPRWMKQERGYNTAPNAPKWGLSSKDMPSATPGSLEDRQAALQAERRKALLSANADIPNSLGRYKRRDSDTNFTYHESEEAAPVYIHKINKDDTLAGVMLKYACQPEVFRKVNRFWPNDNIQTRTHVFLPVDACSIKGKKVDGPDRQDLLGPAFDGLDDAKTPAGPSQNGRHVNITNDGLEASSTLSSLSLTISLADEDSIKHDSWVLLPNFPDPVEILRIPRKSLGYFPRARRKSNTTLTDTSTASTPKTSFDMLRHPPTHAAQVSMSLNASPVRRPNMQLRQDSGRQRSSSTTTTTQGQQPSFSDALRGPGGVGTLRGLRTEPSRPGPADDTLNQKFRQYFPEFGNAILAPPQDFPIPRLSTPGLKATPRVSTDSVRSHRSNSSGIGDVGGALEGWVRKLANKKERGGADRGREKMGDLIELETNSELGEPILDEDDDFPTPTMASMGGLNMGAGMGRSSSASTTDEVLLNERFPIRGRVMNAYGSGKDKGG